MKTLSKFRLGIGFLALLVVAGLLASVAVSAGMAPAVGYKDHDHGPPPGRVLTDGNGPPTVEPLTRRSTSPDDISAQIRLKLDGAGRTHVMNMTDVDRIQIVKLTFQPYQLVDWHTHPGPVMVIVEEGVLTVTTAGDCLARDYGPDEVYIEQGPGDVLKVENQQAETDTVIYAIFFQLPEEGPLTTFEDDPGC